MYKKNFNTTRNKELSFWKVNLRPLTPKYDKFEVIGKLDKLKANQPDSKFWVNLYGQIKVNKLLSVKQLDAINRSYHKIKQYR